MFWDRAKTVQLIANKSVTVIPSKDAAVLAACRLCHETGLVVVVGRGGWLRVVVGLGGLCREVAVGGGGSRFDVVEGFGELPLEVVVGFDWLSFVDVDGLEELPLEVVVGFDGLVLDVVDGFGELPFDDADGLDELLFDDVGSGACSLAVVARDVVVLTEVAVVRVDHLSSSCPSASTEAANSTSTKTTVKRV